MTLYEHSERVGKCKTFMATIKCRQREMFDKWIELGNGNLSDGYLLYKEEYERLKNRVTNIYYWFKNPNTFNHWLKDVGIHKTKNAGNMSRLESVLFSSSESSNIQSYRKFIAICDAWDKENQDRLLI